ncbi:hypothetical protein [Gordonia sp. X0973]|uniref:hypothetical protein n=1 Tax=Gordonia sp. X0973 TaxID=2742602 RepID=UPI000F5432B6|nr:hypothetical protein [Gordonia sp. X0973]
MDAENETPPPQEWMVPTVGRAATRSGSIVVETTEQGLPRAITIEASEMDQPAAVLAKRIVGLCRQAALTAGLRRREQLVAAGVDSATLSYMGLPTADDVRAAEDESDDEPPETWLRRV